MQERHASRTSIIGQLRNGQCKAPPLARVADAVHQPYQRHGILHPQQRLRLLCMHGSPCMWFSWRCCAVLIADGLQAGCNLRPQRQSSPGLPGSHLLSR